LLERRSVHPGTKPSILATDFAGVLLTICRFRFLITVPKLLSRYKTWLSNSLIPDDKSIPNPAEKVEHSPVLSPILTDSSQVAAASTPRSATPVDAPSAESVAADDSILRQYATIIVDVRSMHMNVMTMWEEEISVMLPEAAAEERANTEGTDTVTSSGCDTQYIPDTLRQSLAALTAVTLPMSSHIVAILTKRCCDALLPVRSISSQFRAMSNKQMPKEPSYFVASILRPVKVFFGIGVGQGPGASLREHFLESYATDIFEAVTQRSASSSGYFLPIYLFTDTSII
jgi:hypothetical protein